VTVIGLFGLRPQTDAYFIAVTIPMAVLTISCSRRHGWSSPSLFPSVRNRDMTPGGTYVSLIMRSSGVAVVGACATGALLSAVLLPVQAVGYPPEIVYLSV